MFTVVTRKWMNVCVVGNGVRCVLSCVVAAPCRCWGASSCPGAAVQADTVQRRCPSFPSDCLL